MSSSGVRAGPALPLGTRAVPVPSEHLPVKGCVTCTWREPHPWEASQVKGKGQSWGQSEGGRGLPSGTLRGVGGGTAGPALGGVLASHSCQPHPGLPASSVAKRNPLTPPHPPQFPPLSGPSSQGRVPFRINTGPRVSAVDSELMGNVTDTPGPANRGGKGEGRR